MTTWLLAEGKTFESPGPKDFVFNGAVGLLNKPMLITIVGTVLVAVFFYVATRQAAQVPGRLQFAGESLYGFVRNAIAIDSIGKEGIKYVPYLATVFFFLATLNIAGIVPFVQFPATSRIALPLFIIPAKRVGRKLSAISREQMNMNATMNTQMTERFNVSGALLVKLFGSRRTEVSTFAGRAAKVRDAGIKQAMYGRTFLVALGLVAAVGAAAIYGIGAHLVVSGTIKVGTLVALAALAPRLYQPLTGLTNTRVDMMTALVSFDRVFEVLDAPVAIADKLGAVDLVDPQGRIELRDVWFRYPPAASSSIPSLEAPGLEHSGDPDQDVLKGISLVVEPGETVALVGSSGAGKTTLSSLLPRLYDVTGGAVLIDDLDIRNVTLDSLTAAIGVVSQDPHLFHESVLSNLLYARPDASMEEIEVACRGARIYDMINALPDRFETIVGDRGYRMSGGEKQRLAIARLLLKQPAIVILDEATSHLDNENEAQVQAALEMALSGRTALIIAHRLSTIRNADRIVVLDAGQIVEQGTHEELIALGGFYARQEYLGESHSPVTDDR